MIKEFITRDNVKHAVSLIISFKASDMAEDAILTNTDLEEGSIRVRLAGAAAGGVVAGTARPATDKMVDLIADKIQSYRDNKVITPDIVQ